MLVVLLLAAAACAVGDERARELDALFAQLASAKDEPTARRLERSIQDTWLKSGEPELDAGLAEAIDRARDYDYEKALAVLDDLARRHPGNAEVWNQRATVRFFAGNLDGSLADIDHALALEPRHFGALAGKAMILLQRGDRVRAEESLRAAIALDPFLRERDLLPEAPSPPR